ncbi:MAG: mannonate dehydratase [Candidatus Thorarchaeota archaeon]
MKLVFRWFGKHDIIPLEYIKQIPRVSGIVSALYDVKIGDVWPYEKIKDLKSIIENYGLKFSVIESIPIHEDIKLGKKTRDYYIQNYCQSIKNMGSLGVEVLCYNFMPVFDWIRSDLSKLNPDGSTSLSYNHTTIKKIDLREKNLDLPGWAINYDRNKLEELLKAYSKIDEETLWSNLEYFLKKVIPVAERAGVRLSIHPDDPPWSIFNLPRIIVNETALDRLVEIIDSPYNGITFCTGSLGPNLKMDLVESIHKFGSAGKIPFIHARNIKMLNSHSFQEVAHPSEYGDIDMYKIIKTLVNIDYRGFVRPDHGRMIWGETGKPGYGLYDRALGFIYLSGLWEGIEKTVHSK